MSGCGQRAPEFVDGRHARGSLRRERRYGRRVAKRIEDYALLGDTESAALVSSDGSIDWCCFPRFDSGSCFAALIGNDENGHWSLRPVDPFTVSRRYRPDTLVLETTFSTATGSVTVVDTLVPRPNEHRLVRLVEGGAGHVEMCTELVIRFDYGSAVPWVRSDSDGLHATAGPDALVLRSSVKLKGEGLKSVASFTVSAGESVAFDLAWHRSILEPPRPVDVAATVEESATWWRTWTAGLHYDGIERDAVLHSLRVLKALTYSPTGAIVAAPTTSLPETLGGERNWDYRYCWLRDSTLTLLVLLEAGCFTEAEAWRRWLMRAVAGDPAQLQILYGVDGERRHPEVELEWLGGFAGSRPVRIGNAASSQRQLDVVGEVFDTLHQARENGLDGDGAAWDLQRALLTWLESRWHLPDAGIWEIRGPAANFTFSKVMAWVAFDRAVQAVERHGLPGDVGRWRRVRDEIHASVCASAVDDRGRFVQSYERKVLDAACLIIPIVGFLPPNDERVVATIDAICAELSDGALVRRYDAPDGLAGREGAFILCSFWLVECLAMLGRHDEAHDRLAQLLALRNDVGLLAEEIDPVTHAHLGNFPQAFSHLGLVSAVMELSVASHGPSERRSGVSASG
ncbi:MAG: glycoside hydrolase family 15 protein [Acidimicrobiia bacterium]